jgi:GNAT superfamily N-acetyltransferase
MSNPRNSPAQWRVTTPPKPPLERYVLKSWKNNARSVRVPFDARAAHSLFHGPSILYTGEDVGNPGFTVGWALATRLPSATILHYVYVREVARNHGLGAVLLAYCGVVPGELYTTVSGRLPRPMRDWYSEVEYIDPRRVTA